MTPVQLPEVPASHSYVEVRTGHGRVQLEVPAKDYYTAAQLREYATEAVMADRLHRAVDFLAMAAKWRLSADVQELGKSTVIGKCVDDLLTLIAETTPSETNSER